MVSWIARETTFENLSPLAYNWANQLAFKVSVPL